MEYKTGKEISSAVAEVWATTMLDRGTEPLTKLYPPNREFLFQCPPMYKKAQGAPRKLYN